ncbi:hypothetical protein F5B19DRAFT_468662 [Rostrohypoxylon terebratum]|nr:hypothetical protein F5B19DRAFT_468662 [Rostrohypoxylon terebratum]
MVSKNIVAVLGLTSTALATYSPEALKNLRDLRAEHVVVEVREAQPSSSSSSSNADSVSSACSSSAEAIITDAPTPPANLETFFMSFVETVDFEDSSVLCQLTAAVPSSLSVAYSSYDQQASSWLSAKSGSISALASQCADSEGAASIAQVVTALEVYVAAGCTGAASSGTSSGAGASTSSVSKALAARPTGIFAGAVAAAGVLGAAAML